MAHGHSFAIRLRPLSAAALAVALCSWVLAAAVPLPGGSGRAAAAPRQSRQEVEDDAPSEEGIDEPSDAEMDEDEGDAMDDDGDDPMDAVTGDDGDGEQERQWIPFLPEGFDPEAVRVVDGLGFGGMGGESPSGWDDPIATEREDALADLIARRNSLTREIEQLQAADAADEASRWSLDEWARIISATVRRFDDAEEWRASQALATSMMRSIVRNRRVRIEEGVARAVSKEDLAALAERGEVLQHDGFWYHAEPLACPPAMAARITALVVDPKNLAGPGGGKFCGGFHPDIRLDYGRTTVLVCLGCRDIRYASGNLTATFDLTQEALRALEAIARESFRHRAFEAPPGP